MDYEKLLEKYKEVSEEKEILIRINEQSKKTVEEMNIKLPNLVESLSSNLNSNIFGNVRVRDSINTIYREKQKIEESTKQNEEKIQKLDELLEKIAEICEENIEELESKKTEEEKEVERQDKYNLEKGKEIEEKEREKAKLKIELAQIEYFMKNGLYSKKDLSRKKELEKAINKIETDTKETKRLIDESTRKKAISEIDIQIEKYNKLISDCRLKEQNISKENKEEKTVEATIDAILDVNGNEINKEQDDYDRIKEILNEDIETFEPSIAEPKSIDIGLNENNPELKPLGEPLYVHKDNDKKEDDYENILNIFNQPINEEKNDSIDIKNASIFDILNETKKEEDDELLNKAAEIVITTGTASISNLQRRLKTGYARAARLLDELEKNGIVGPYNGAQPRKVLMSLDEFMSKNTNQKGSIENIDIDLTEAHDNKLPKIEPLYVHKDNDIEERLQNLGYKEPVPKPEKKVSLDEIFEPFVDQIEQEQPEQNIDEEVKESVLEKKSENVLKKGFNAIHNYFIEEIKENAEEEKQQNQGEQDSIEKEQNELEQKIKKVYDKTKTEKESNKIKRKVKKKVPEKDSKEVKKKGLSFLADILKNMKEKRDNKKLEKQESLLDNIMCPNCGSLNNVNNTNCASCGYEINMNVEENIHGRKK